MAYDKTNAVFGVVGTVVGAIVSTFLKSYLEKADLSFSRTKKRYALNGVWRGNAIQNEDPLIAGPYSIELDLNSSAGKIMGKARVDDPNESIILTVNGKFKEEGLLKLDYENKDKTVLQFGTFILKLSPGGKKLTGRFIGFGHV